MNSKFVSLGKNKPIKKLLQTNQLLLIATGLLIVNLIVGGAFASILVGLFSLAAFWALLIIYGKKSQFLSAHHKLLMRYGLSPSIFLWVFGMFWLEVFASPAGAQFFTAAESWLLGVFPGAEAVVPIVFNVLRALFLLYVGISLVQVVQAARQDQDWQTLARTPLIIVVAVTVADVITQVITGGAAA